MSGIITFAANNDLFRKRKRVYRACDECKRKRKRCTHTFDGDDGTATSVADTDVRARRRTRISSVTIQDSVCSNDQDQHSPRSNSSRIHARSESPTRFLGHLNPEATLRQQRSDQGNLPGNECGYWAPSSQQSEAANPPTLCRSQESDEEREIGDALTAYLAAVRHLMLPPKQHLHALTGLYFKSIQQILPIVDEHDFQVRVEAEKESTLLRQAICLVASKHDDARSHLYLPGKPSMLDQKTFGKRLYRSIKASLDAGTEHDRIVLIQVCILLSFYVEGADGAEQASRHLATAVHYAHTIGMQFGRGRPDERSEYLHRLFWCLTSFDILNACIHGRPVMMHPRDNCLEDPTTAPETRYTRFGIWLQLSAALDRALSYYRPRLDRNITGWEEGFPSFEEIIGENGANLEPTTIATLELFYHTVAITSHRNRGVNVTPAGTPSYVRQTLSASRIILILSQECQSDLPPLPLVPYALSLSLCVAYRAFRQTKLQTHRARAREDLKTCCELLEKMGSAWWSAAAMAELGRAALRKAVRGGKDPQGRNIVEPAHVPQKNLSPNLSPADPHQEHLNAAAATLVSSADNGVASHRVGPEILRTGLQQDDLPAQQVNLEPASSSLIGFDFGEASPDWLNFDNAFENFDMLLGSSGADLSPETLASWGDGTGLVESVNGG